MPFVWGTMLMVGFPGSTDTLRHAVTVLIANPLIARCSVEIVPPGGVSSVGRYTASRSAYLI